MSVRRIVGALPTHLKTPSDFPQGVFLLARFGKKTQEIRGISGFYPCNVWVFSLPFRALSFS
jgi:hypothetical protein